MAIEWSNKKLLLLDPIGSQYIRAISVHLFTCIFVYGYMFRTRTALYLSPPLDNKDNQDDENYQDDQDDQED